MRRRMCLLAVSAAIVALGVWEAGAETVEFEPVQVACITGETAGAADARVLVAFDLSSVPDTAVVQFAGLRLADQGAVAWNVPYVPVVAGALTKAWDASATSWYQAAGDQAWDTPGGDWDPRLTAYRVIIKAARAPSELLLTDLVATWVSGAVPNYGLVVMMTEVEELADIVPYFNSQFLKPVLRVRYFVPGEGP